MSKRNLIQGGLIASAAVGGFLIGQLGDSSESQGGITDRMPVERPTIAQVDESPASPENSTSVDQPTENVLALWEACRHIDLFTYTSPSIHQRLAKLDLATIEEYLVESISLDRERSNGERSTLTYDLLTHWGERDASSALEFIDSKPSPYDDNSSGYHYAYLLILSKAARTDPEFALTKMRAIEDPKFRLRTRQAILDELSKGHLEAYLAEVHHWDETFFAERMIHGQFERLVKREPETAVKMLKHVPSRLRSQIILKITQTWANSDPTAALKWANSHENEFERVFALRGVAIGAAPHNFKTSKRLIAQMRGANRAETIEQVMGELARVAPQKALNYANELEKTEDLASAIKGIFDNSLLENRISIQEHLNFLSKQGLRRSRRYLISSLSKRCFGLEGAGYAAILEALNSSDREQFFRFFNEHHDLVDPDCFLESIEAIRSLGIEEFNLSLSLKAIADHAPLATIEFLQKGKMIDDEQEALGEAIAGLSIKAPEEALSFLPLLKPNEARTEVIGKLSEQLSKFSPRIAEEWMNRLKGEEKRLAELKSLEAVAKFDAQLALEKVGKFVKADTSLSSPDLKSCLSAITKELAEQAPEVGLQFILKLEPSTTRRSLLDRFYDTWVRDDLVAACLHTNPLPIGSQRDLIVPYIVRSLAEEHPIKAFKWAQTMTLSKRPRILKVALTPLVMRDRNAAENLVKQATKLNRQETHNLVLWVRTSKDHFPVLLK